MSMLTKLNVTLPEANELMSLAALFNGKAVLFDDKNTDVVARNITASLGFNPDEALGDNPGYDTLAIKLIDDGIDVIRFDYNDIHMLPGGGAACEGDEDDELSANEKAASDGKDENALTMSELYEFLYGKGGYDHAALVDYTSLNVDDYLDAAKADIEALQEEGLLDKLYARYTEWRQSDEYATGLLDLARNLSAFPDTLRVAIGNKGLIEILHTAMATVFLQKVSVYEYSKSALDFTCLLISGGPRPTLVTSFSETLAEAVTETFESVWNMSLDYLLDHPKPEDTMWCKLFARFFNRETDNVRKVEAISALSELAATSQKAQKLLNVVRSSYMAHIAEEHPYILADIFGDPAYKKNADAVVAIDRAAWLMIGASSLAKYKWYVCFVRDTEGFIVKRLNGKITRDNLGIREEGVPIAAIGTEIADPEIPIDFLDGNTVVFTFVDGSLAVLTPLTGGIIWTDGINVETISSEDYTQYGLAVLKECTNAPARFMYVNPTTKALLKYLSSLEAIARSMGNSLMGVFGKDIIESVMPKPKVSLRAPLTRQAVQQQTQTPQPQLQQHESQAIEQLEAETTAADAAGSETEVTEANVIGEISDDGDLVTEHGDNNIDPFEELAKLEDSGD